MDWRIGGQTYLKVAQLHKNALLFARFVPNLKVDQLQSQIIEPEGLVTLSELRIYHMVQAFNEFIELLDSTIS